MLPITIISFLLLDLAKQTGQEGAQRLEKIVREQLTKLAESKGQTIDWDKQLVCVPGMSAAFCEDLTVWLKSTAAQTVKNIYLDTLMKYAYPQKNQFSCWVATPLILLGFLNGRPNKQTEEDYFQNNLKRIITTENMINASDHGTGLFTGIQNSTQVAQILNRYGPGKELSYEDSLYVYKQILWKDDITTLDLQHPENIEWHKLKLCQFMFNTDPDKTGIPRPDNVSVEQRSKEFHLVVFAVMYRFGIVTTKYSAFDRAVVRGLLWPFATEWFDNFLGLQVEKVNNYQLTEQRLANTLKTHGPFVVNTSLRISDPSEAIDPLKSHYIIIVDAVEVSPGLYHFQYINTAVPDPNSGQYTVELKSIPGPDLTSLFNEVDNPRIVVYQK